MIFTEIVIHNFGIYKGRHIVDLKPSSTSKPIILFGGLNGGGKTTFLDALQLTLYGKFAKCSNRGDLGYNDYLKETINSHVDPKEGAVLELEFIHYNEGNETVYRIKRYWKRVGKSIHETIEIIKNGLLDPVMSEQWYEYIDEFIPSNISSLFFFDGEQVEGLANPDTSSEIIQTGIMSLLGLDLVDRLQDDLRTVERRRLTKQVSSKTSKAITQLENELENLQQQSKLKQEMLAQKTSEIDSLERQIIDAKRSYKQHGGDLYDQRELIEKQHDHNEQQLKNIEDNICRYAEGPAPLLLTQNLIHRAQEQALKERSALLNRNIIETIAERDLEILGQFSEQTSNNTAVSLLNKLLSKDRNLRQESAQQATPLNVHPNVLQSFDEAFFVTLKQEAKDLQQVHKQTSEELAISDRHLSSIPEADMIKDIATQLKAFEDNKKIAQGELNTFQQLYDGAVRTVNSKKNELDRALHNANDEQLDSHRAKCIIEHIQEAQQTLMLYRKSLVEKHISRLEALIKESFLALIRKKDLIKDILINPDDFNLHVVTPNGETIPAKRLSAGERQLLAISILWGLAKASGRPLPIIIDTPLGRLDSEHRGLLIDNYLPSASHQVILLSTDTEIDSEYRDELAEHIGKEYHIQYQESQQTSTITPGYF